MPTCPRCQRDVAPGAIACPAGHPLVEGEWPSLKAFLSRQRPKRLDAVRITRKIARDLAKIHAGDTSHGALSMEQVFVDPLTQNIKLGPPVPMRPPADRSGRIRLVPLNNPADDIVALGRIFAALSGAPSAALPVGDPNAVPLETGEPELNAIADECIGALPTNPPRAADIEAKLRKWEEHAEREQQRLVAAVLKIKSELQPWLHFNDRLREFEPEADDPTLVEIARRQKIVAGIAAEIEVERGRHARAAAPTAVMATTTAPTASSSRSGLVTGLLVGALATALVALAFVHFEDGGRRAPTTAAPADAAHAAAVEIPKPPAHDMAISAAPHDMATRAASASPDLGRPDGGSASPCPPGMRFIPGGKVKDVHIIPFCMDATEVTLAEYEACLAEGKCLHRHVRCDEDGFAGSDPEQCDCTRGTTQQSHPANCVTWQAAMAYCTARGKILPSRDQWQWALHAATPDQPFPWGPKNLPKHACLNRSAPCPVDQYTIGASPQGIQDLVGNVAEWTRDHSVNGTSFRDAEAGNPATRERLDAEAWSDSVGFRCVRTRL